MTLGSEMMILTIFSYSFSVSLSVSTALTPACSQLKHISCPLAHGLWLQLFECEVPVRGLHYTLLKTTLFDLTRFYFEGPSLKNSHHWPLRSPSCSSPSPHNPRPKKGEKYVDLIFTWLHRVHAGKGSVLTVCEARRFSCLNMER